MVAQVVGQGLADIGRERERVVRAALPPHLQHAGPPVDIIEFQGDHLAGPQSQAGQQENDGVITAGDGRVPLASVDDPFDFFRLEVLRHLGESPLRHGRDGPREVNLGLSVRKRNRKKERRAVTISLATLGLPERACRRRNREMSSGTSSRTGIGPSPKRSTTRRRMKGQYPPTVTAARPPTREAARRGGRVARADNGHSGPVEQSQVAPYDEQRWRVLELGQEARIKALPEREITRAVFLDLCDLAFGIGAGAQRRGFAAAPAREVRNGGKRRSALPKRATSWR